MILLNPKTEKFEHLDHPSREIMRKTIEFFENKGKKKLKEDDHERVWYADFLEFIKKEKIFAALMTQPNTETRIHGGTPSAYATSMRSSPFMVWATGTPGRSRCWDWVRSGWERMRR